MGVLLDLEIHDLRVTRVDVENVPDYFVGSESSVANVHHVDSSVSVEAVNRKRGSVVVVARRFESVQVDGAVQTQGWKDVVDDAAGNENNVFRVTQSSLGRNGAILVLATENVRPDFFFDPF